MILDLKVDEVAEVIDWPVERWAGQCYAVACQMVEHGVVEGRPVYGYYTGPIASGSLFDRDSPITHHGWIEVVEGYRRWVVDPTRWVFENSAPYIHIFEVCDCDDFNSWSGDSDDEACSCGHVGDEHDGLGFLRPCVFSDVEYDEGGNRWREEHMVPCPAFDASEPTVDIALFLAGSLHFVTNLVGNPANTYEMPLTVTVRQAAWLANLPTQVLGNHAEPVYRALESANLRGFIPIDNWIKFFGRVHAQAT